VSYGYVGPNGVLVRRRFAWYLGRLLRRIGNRWGSCGGDRCKTVASLPPQSTPGAVQGNQYYYSGGVYYAPAPEGKGYAVVPPPKGAVTPSVPDSSTTVYGAEKSFVYANGVFYEQVGHGYKIVEPPLGVLVPSIPEGATVVTVNDAKYFEFGGVWYRPFYSGSDVVYQTVPNPSP
jgi:hypothetical protein